MHFYSEFEVSTMKLEKIYNKFLQRDILFRCKQCSPIVELQPLEYVKHAKAVHFSPETMEEAKWCPWCLTIDDYEDDFELLDHMHDCANEMYDDQRYALAKTVAYLEDYERYREAKTTGQELMLELLLFRQHFEGVLSRFKLFHDQCLKHYVAEKNCEDHTFDEEVVIKHYRPILTKLKETSQNIQMHGAETKQFMDNILLTIHAYLEIPPVEVDNDIFFKKKLNFFGDMSGLSDSEDDNAENEDDNTENEDDDTDDNSNNFDESEDFSDDTENSEESDT